MAEKRKTIGIRLSAELERLLGEEAARRGLKPTPCAENLVAEALTRSGTPLEEKLAQIQAAIDRMERELPAKLKAVLTAAAIGQPGVPMTGTPPGTTSLRDWVSQPPEDD